ncbi:alpha-amylase family glycosyl hydrolase [Nonomuraea thailandensis]
MIFEVWAPKATAVEVDVLGGRRAMSPGEGGWWSAEVEGPSTAPGTPSWWTATDRTPTPHPAAAEGIFGQSAVYEHARFTWSDHDWKGRDLRGAVIYELHIGTFTPEGTFASAIELPHLVELCVDFVEVMPVAPVPGGRNWGYDGVDLYAVTETYGGPDGLKSFVDACHRAGIGVILDVVYNHLGPSGNFLRPFGPYFSGFDGSYWGEAVNLDGPESDEVRRYFIGNALQWLRDFHIDGLRLDAVHALHDKRATHLLAELSEEVDALACSVGRPLSLIAESDLNDPRMVRALDRRARHDRAVGRRRAPRPALRRQRREPRLLRGLRPPFRPGQGAHARGRARRDALQLPGPRARQLVRGRAWAPAGGLPAEPRPDRQQARR